MLKKLNKKGFTLFELLAVLAILAIIAGIAVPRVMKTIENSRIDSVCTSMEMLANAARRMVIEAQIAGSTFATETYSSGNFGSGVKLGNGGAFEDYIEDMDDAFIVEIAENGDSITVVYKDKQYQGVTAEDVANKSLNDQIDLGSSSNDLDSESTYKSDNYAVIVIEP